MANICEVSTMGQMAEVPVQHNKVDLAARFSLQLLSPCLLVDPPGLPTSPSPTFLHSGAGLLFRI